MKISFFFTWTRKKDQDDETMKSIGGGFRLPRFLRFLARKKT